MCGGSNTRPKSIYKFPMKLDKNRERE